MNDSTMFGAALVALLLVACLGYFAGRDAGRRAEQREQREHLLERGCEQIAREPELWECEGERVEVKP